MSEKVYTHALFWWGNLKEREHLFDGGVDRKKILKCILTKYNSLHRLPLAQYDVQRCVIKNKVINTRRALTK
jgi:hypothetical protein